LHLVPVSLQFELAVASPARHENIISHPSSGRRSSPESSHAFSI
jgi:hypothetical protein